MDVHCEMNQEVDSNYPNSYSKEVEEALSRLNLKSDSLDDPDFNVISYINEVNLLQNVYDIFFRDFPANSHWQI